MPVDDEGDAVRRGRSEADEELRRGEAHVKVRPGSDALRPVRRCLSFRVGLAGAGLGGRATDGEEDGEGWKRNGADESA